MKNYNNIQKFFIVCLLISIASSFFVPFRLSIYLFLGTAISFLASKLPQNSFYKWQKFILWVIGIFYSLVTYYVVYPNSIETGDSFLISATNQLSGFVMIFPTLLVLFEGMNWLYLKIRKK